MFINMQRLTVHFISTIPNVIHVFGHVFFCKACHFCLHCQVLSNTLTYFLVTSGYGQSHSNSHLLNARFVNVIQKVHLLNCVDGNESIACHWRLPACGRITADNGYNGGAIFFKKIAGGAGKARFNVATPTSEARTRPLHVQHTYYRIIFKQNPFNIISRGVQRWTSTDFRLK